MKVSQRKYSFDKQPFKKQLKKPKDLVTKLNNQIQSMQQAIKTYNQKDRNSLAWKKRLNMPLNSCQLKQLTQPKFQHILLESNFVNLQQNTNQSITHKNNNNSVLLNSIKKGQQFISNNTTSKLKKATSIVLGENRQNKNLLEKSKEIVEKSPIVKFNSFHEEISKFDKVAYLDNGDFKKNYSHKRQPCQTARILRSENRNKQSLHGIDQQQTFVLNDTSIHSIKLIDDESKSIVRGSTMNFYNNNPQKQTDEGFNMFKFLPISEEKNFLSLKNQEQTQNIRRKIQQKTSRLQRQWVKTQFYRQKFNITQHIQSNPSTSRTTKKSVGKLATIISKIENRRPATSISGQRQKLYSQQSNIRGKSKTIDIYDEPLVKWSDEKDGLNNFEY